MPIIIITIIMMYIILIVWTNHNLGNMEIIKKVIFMVVSFFIVYIVTSITFNISKNSLVYPESIAISQVKNILVLVFTGLNLIFLLPYLSRKFEKLYQEDIKISEFNKSILISILILVVLLVLECGYMKDTQQMILKIYENKK